MIFKLAIGNVRASLRDFAVYFATLACAACLLYAFTASTDYLAALDLTDAQRESIATAFSARDVRRRPLIDLLNADRTPERMRGSGRIGARAQAVAAVALLAVIWGSCVFAPGIFITLIIPMGFAAVFATYFVFHLVARRVERQIKRNPDRFLAGLRPFTAGRVFAKAESNCMALSCACVLVAAAVCMICAGFAFSVGVRAIGELDVASVAFARRSLLPCAVALAVFVNMQVLI